MTKPTDSSGVQGRPSARQMARKLFVTVRTLAIVIAVGGTLLGVYLATHPGTVPTSRDGTLFVDSLGYVVAVPPNEVRDRLALGHKRATSEDIAREQAQLEKHARNDGYRIALLSWIPFALLWALAAWVRWLVKPEAPRAGSAPPAQ